MSKLNSFLSFHPILFKKAKFFVEGVFKPRNRIGHEQAVNAEQKGILGSPLVNISDPATHFRILAQMWSH